MAANNVDRKTGKDKRSAGPESKELLIEQMRNRIEFLEKELQSRQEELRARTDEYGGPARERERAELALRESEERLDFSLKSADIGAWDLNLIDHTAWRSLRHDQIFGYREQLPEWTYEMFLSHVLPEDRDFVDSAFQKAVSGHSDWDFECRICRADGEVRGMWAHGRAVYDEQGQPLRMLGINVDITERKKINAELQAARDELERRVKERTAALHESEERFRATFEQAAVGMSQVSLDGRFIRVNKKFCEITGYSPEELIQRSVSDITYPEDVPEEDALIHRLLAGEIPTFSREKRYVRKSGSIIWISLSVSVVHENGKKYFIGVTQDITKRKQAEEALRESEEKFRVLANASSTMIWLYQGERFVYVNNAGERLTGYSIDELLKMKFWDVAHPDDRDLFRERGLARQRGEPVPQRYEVKLLTKGGETRWVELSAGRIMYRGASAGIATFFDITERKRAEEALKFERSQLLSIFDSIDEIIYVADPCTYEILYANKAMQDRFGKRLVAGTCYMELQNRNSPCEFCTNPIILKNKGEPYRWEFHNPTVNRDLMIYDRIIKWPDGRDVRFELAIDITGRKRAEEELANAKARAELYLDLMGHDINNMHQIALGYLELARDMQADADGREFLDRPIEVLQRSARLIKNVRKLQKLHDEVFQIEPVDVARVLADLQQEFGGVSNKSITLNLNACKHCHVQANELLNDVFSNLVSNAIKHTGDHADIIIDLDVVKDQGQRYYRIFVEDDGPGIPDEFKGKIFNRLLKGTEKAKGMGLGLYLVKSLVGSFDGRVWVEDRVPGDHSKGAKFVVMLPALEK